MKKLLFLLIVLVSICIISASGCIEGMRDVSQIEHNKPIGEIYGSTTVGQTFASRQSNLSVIEIIMATYMRINTHDVIFHLRASPSSPIDIATIKVNAAKIADNQYHRFSFPPIPDSKDKTYYFFIESPDSAPGNAITIWYSTKDVYKDGSAFVNHKAVEGDLAFKTYYTSDYKISNVISYFIDKMQHDKPFFIVYFSLMAILIFLLVKLPLSGRKLKKK